MRTMKVYGCEDCSGCEHKGRYLCKYNEKRDADKNKSTRRLLRRKNASEREPLLRKNKD